MSANLITLDLGGLLSQLTGIETHVHDLKHNVGNHDTTLKENHQSFVNFKLEEAQKINDLKREISRLIGEFEATNANMKEMDELVIKIKETLQRAEEIEATQQNYNADSTYKMNHQKHEFSDFKKEVLTELGLRVQQKEFDQLVKTELKSSVYVLQKEAEEMKEQIKTSDEQIQEILDRVETMETHGVNPLKDQQAAEAEVEDADGEMQDQNTAEEEASLEVVQRPVDKDEIQEISDFIRKLIFDQKCVDRKDLFDQTLNHYDPQPEVVELKLDDSTLELKEKDSNELEQEEEPPVEDAQDPTDQVPEPKIESHLPSTIEQILEDHVRSVGTHLVWLDRLRPKFVMEDGRLQLGSDYGQVFSHVEVQTYQQQMLLKNQAKDSLHLIELKSQIEEMKRGLKVESKRIDCLEEGADVDLSHLQVDGAGLKELFRIMQELKTEILQKSASKDSIRAIEREILDIKAKGTAQKQSQMDQELKEELQQGLVLMSQFPAQLNSLQMQIMKSETLSYDVDRLCQQIQRRMTSFEETASLVTKDLESISKEENQNNLSKIKELAAIKFFCSTQFVSVQQHSEFNDSVNQSLSQMNVMQNQALANQSKLNDHGKTLRTYGSQLKAIEQLQNQVKVLAEQSAKTLKETITFDMFNEETTYIKSLMTQPKGAKKGSDFTAQMNVRAVAGGGMSAAQKNQIKDLVEGFDRHDQSLRRLSTGFASLNVDELKHEVIVVQKQLREKALKIHFDRLELSLTEDVLANKAQMKIQQDEVDRQCSKIDERLERFYMSNAERDEGMERVQGTITRIEEQIVAMKRGNAAGNLRNKLLKQSEDQKPSNFVSMNSDDENESENISKLKDDIYKIQKLIKQKFDSVDYKFKKLLPLIDGGDEDEKDSKKGSSIKKGDLESRLNDKIFKLMSGQSADIFKLRNEVEDLKKTFEEKIRRQALVKEQKKITTEETELKRSLNKRPKFLAQQMTRQLVVNGRLPQFEQYGDHIARYGKGFSQMLNMATIDSGLPSSGRHAYSPRLVNGVSLGELSDSYQFDGHELTSQPAYTYQDDVLSSHSQHRVLMMQQTASNPEMDSLEKSYAPIENPHEHRIMHLKSQRVHPTTKAHIFRAKKESQLRPANLTSLIIPTEPSGDLPNGNETWNKTSRLPMISTSRSIQKDTIVQMIDAGQNTHY